MKYVTIFASIISLPIALYLCHKKARNKWIWGFASIFLPLYSLLILVQLDHSNAPAKKIAIPSWLVRISLIILFSIGLVSLGESHLVNNETAYTLKAQLLGLISPDVTSVEGNILSTTSGEIEIVTFFNSAFALAALGAVLGIFAFRRAIGIILSLATTGFLLGLLIEITQTTYLISMLYQKTIDVYKFYDTGFNIGFYILLLITLPVYWLASKKYVPNQPKKSSFESGDPFEEQIGEVIF